jgi:N-acetylglucosaminyl-diphospho-decaprenol L-rhamnosyltransferase
MSETAEQQERIGVVVVTYNSAAVIGQCLESLPPSDYSVVVVDNASADETCWIVRQFPVQLIANKDNRGFAAAVNQGFQLLHVRSILLLNPDVCLVGDVRELDECLSDQDVGAVTAILTDEQGVPESTFQFRRFPRPVTLLFETLGLNRLFPNNPVNRAYRYREETWSVERKVDQPAGAFILVRRSAWQAIGGMDESFYPLWFEDVDFSYRLRLAGWSTKFLPIVVGTHVGSHSVKHLEPGIRQLYWYRSLLRYSAKHFSVVWVRILALSVLMALTGKSVIMAIHPRHRGNPKQFVPALGLALRTFVHGRLPSDGAASV